MDYSTVCNVRKLETTWLSISKGQLWYSHIQWLKNNEGDLPGGAVVKNLPANVGGMGSSPGSGRSHRPRSN